MKGLHLKRFLSIVSFALILLSFGSCSKDEPYYKVQFKVIDFVTQKAGKGIEVKSTTIDGNINGTLPDVLQTHYTDTLGMVSFSFENKANLKFLFRNNSNTKKGETNVKLKADETIKKTVYIYP